MGKPASMMSTPSASSWRARPIFSSVLSLQPGTCSPSRRVVSKMKIFLSDIRLIYKGLKKGGNNPFTESTFVYFRYKIIIEVVLHPLIGGKRPETRYCKGF